MPMTPTGFEPLPAADVLTEIQTVYTNAYGAGFNLNPASVNGVQIQELTNMALQVQNAETYIYSSVYNPYVTPAPFLDAICKFNNITRIGATKSIVECKLTGLPGLLIPAGSLAKNTDGLYFQSVTDAILNGSGQAIDVLFQAVTSGAIPVPMNSVNQIAQPIPGWDTINNEVAGTEGTTEETDYNLRNRRLRALAVNSTNMLSSIVAALAVTPNVADYIVLMNNTSAPVPINGITVQPGTIYASVYGGTDTDIAAALYRTAGNSVLVGDTAVTYVNPDYSWAIQTITFQRAIQQPIQIDINLIINQLNYPSDIKQKVKDAIKANWDEGYTASDGTPIAPVSMRTGIIYTTRFGGSINDLGIFQYTIEIGELSGAMGSTVTVNANKAPTLDIGNINVLTNGNP